MKLKLTASLLAAVLTFIPVSGVGVYAEDTAAVENAVMPSPFFDEGNAAFYHPCGKLDTIPDSLKALVPEESITAWLAFLEVFHTEVATELSAYPNICSFVRTFELSAAESTQALEGYLTEEELAAVFSGTDAEILNSFASAYTIVIDAQFYTPQWVYTHTEADYTEAGISPERLAEQFPYYRMLHFTREAAAAFSDKLLAYTNQAPGLTGLSNPLLLGDLTNDGKITPGDVAMLQKYLLGPVKLNNMQLAASDMNADGEVDVLDLAYLRKALLEHHPERMTVSLPVIEFNQHPDYPTGCESAALYMLLQYYQTDVTMAQIVSVLPKGPMPYAKNGVTYGANPEREFVGDPRNASSYGVFNRPIATTANVFRNGAVTKTGASLTEVLSILNTGNPVIAWYTTNPDTGITYRRQWYDYETGELIRWPGGEHAVVICGHDETNITYRDPNTGGTRTMAQSKFQQVFDELGGRIVYYKD